ncbi:MAG: lipocalin-like domain-containing protein [Halofilum sp. (in: g-proteobacteria)]|nr:lipocalin-like domain-containing protein [Halofilum sp. (in: g-proteobacteria)]
MRALAAVSIALALAGCSDQPRAPDGAGIELTGALGGTAAEGFARATDPREFRFPYDHGPHPQYRNEWWYVTGNLRDERGRRYGFQLTFFRIGLAPGEAERPSRWATNHVWMAHFALTDVTGEAFHDHERLARGGDMALAGASREPVRVWLEDWTLERRADDTWRLEASADGQALALDLAPRKAPVLQGDAGLSQKSAAAGNASYYYSLTRIAADGTLALDGDARSVTGSAWMDREWSTSALGPDQRGWDWFALQLDDGTDVMFYRLRRADGGTDPHSAGVVVGPDGATRRLGRADFALDVLDRWTSPRGGSYPARWRIDVAGIDGRLTVEPVLADQELDGVVRYWEGAVDVLRAGERVGRGYVELTGYAEDAAGAARSR